MARRILFRIEGCNLGATVYDTDDLSTIRGASLAYLRHPERWHRRLEIDLGAVEIVVLGASDGIYRVKAADVDAVEQAILKVITNAQRSDSLDETLPFLTFSYAAIDETGNFKNDLAHLIARCRARQLQQITVDIPPRRAKGPCEDYDGIRPADTKHWRQDGTKVEVSASVDARRSYGRSQRQQFYRDELDVTTQSTDVKSNFADSFQDLIKGEFRDSLPPSLHGKHAVIYLDGNKFTKIREAVAYPNNGMDCGKGLATFADHVRKQRREVLGSVLRALDADPLMRADKTVQGRLDALRFETLLWGGDEALFVMPAWKVMEALPALAASLDNDAWTFAGHRLTHAVGIVICSIKTPIAVARSLAEDVANAAKPLCGDDIKNQSNVFSFQVLESVEPPRADLAEFRTHLYGTAESSAFTLVGSADVDAMLTAIRQFQADDGGLPRSQLFKLINAARSKALFQAGKAAAEFLDEEAAKAFRRCGCKLDLKTAVLGHTDAAPLMPLIRLAELWDYVDPFGRNTPSASTAEAVS